VRLGAAVALALAAIFTAISGCRGRGPDDTGPLRLGYFPNVTHAQALVGLADGTFARALGGRLQAKAFNAGPSAMEALLAGEVDACYVGPGPAIIAYLRTHGEGLRVIAGAASGGAALVVRDARKPADLVGMRVASPQLGNTQDVALRWWLREHGLSDRGGRHGVHVVPLANPDVLAMFARRDLAGAWAPEPWATRLVHAGGHILVDERSLWPDGRFPSAVLVASTRALARRRTDLRALISAHLELTARWRRDRAGFAHAANKRFGMLTGKPLGDEILLEAFSRVEPISDPLVPQLQEEARRAQLLGYAPEGDVSGMVDLSLLAETARR
jgi:NitT/TauT family transport system substrate-binding protein